MGFRSTFARIVSALSVAAAATLTIPATAQAAVPLAGGAGVSFGGERLCTIGATGYDRAGRAVALTAGHCAERIGEPVLLEGNAGAGVIGHVAAINQVLDYSVIELDRARANPVRQPGVAGSAPTPHDAFLCKVGRTTGHSCGHTWQLDGPWFWAQFCAAPGDSGGPVMAGDRLVGMVSGGGIPPMGSLVGSLGNVLPECYHPVMTGISLPAVGVSFDAIVGDATHRNWPGAGFRMA